MMVNGMNLGAGNPLGSHCRGWLFSTPAPALCRVFSGHRPKPKPLVLATSLECKEVATVGRNKDYSSSALFPAALVPFPLMDSTKKIFTGVAFLCILSRIGYLPPLQSVEP